LNEKGQTVTNQYVVLKRKVSVEQWEKIKATMTDLTFAGLDEKKLNKAEKAFYRDLRAHAIFTDPVDDQLRVYPNQDLACHILGYVGVNGDTNSPEFTQTIGVDGIERTFNSKLAGVRGWRVTETDRAGREQVAMRDQDVEPRDGWNVVLTIDSVIQHILETELAEGMAKHQPISISGVVVRPRTGEILAMATLPDFDPNRPGNNADARRNRVIADLIEPGSTFKIVVLSGALNDRVVSLSDTFNCENGHFAFAGKVLHDHEPNGVLTAEHIITKSSNIGAAKIGIRLGQQRLYDYIRAFGFGDRTGVPLLGEHPGIVYPTKKWSRVSIAQIPMGHGLCVTRLQMTMAMCALANNGVLMRPMLVNRLEDRDGHVVARYSPERVRQVISETAAAQMLKALKTVPTPEGTAEKAALEHYTVAGKTGTAQKVEHGEYVHGKYFSSFIGFFPADNPELCISIILDEPKQQGYYGGLTAGPVFKQVAERAANYLNIRPDLKGNDPSENSTLTDAPDRASKTLAARPLNNQ
jgi:cell division protein FtsI/penicillin-binding protein 2